MAGWTVVANGDTSAWKPVQGASASSPAASPDPAPSDHWYSPLTDLVTGAVKGANNTIRGIGNIESKIPTLKSLMPADVRDYLGDEGARMNTANGTMQSIGKGAEQLGEWFIPGLGEEAAMADAIKAAPKMAPLARIAYNAGTSAALNTAQGGSPITGAITGAAGGALGEGMRALAPGLAESSLGIRKVDRAYGRNPGKTILEETTALSPGKIAEQAQGKLNTLAPQLRDLVTDASTKPGPLAPRIAGFLPPPTEDLTLAPTPSPRSPRMTPMAFDAQINPESPWEPRSGDPMAPISDYPGINPHYMSGSAHPELNGRIPTTQGVLLNHQPTMDMSITPEKFLSVPPATVPNTIASLEPARGIVSDAMGTAKARNAEKESGQLKPIADHLGRWFDTGEAIPENITPLQLLNLKRGIGDEFVHNWDQAQMSGTKGVAANVYHSLADQLHSIVPGTAELDNRMMNLIPVAKRAESAELGAGTAQRIADRIGRPTGGMLAAATGAALGGPAGAAVGTVVPDLLTSPAMKMFGARLMHSPLTGMALRPLLGAGLNQFDRDSQ